MMTIDRREVMPQNEAAGPHSVKYEPGIRVHKLLIMASVNIDKRHIVNMVRGTTQVLVLAYILFRYPRQIFARGKKSRFHRGSGSLVLSFPPSA